MATAQKRGFRFPWGGDSRREEPEPSDSQSIDERLAGVPEDLGRGPFDLPEGPLDSGSDGTETPAGKAAPEAAAPGSPPRLVVRAPNAAPMVIAAPAPAAPAPAPAALEPEPELEPEPVEPAPEAAATAPETAEPEAQPAMTEPVAAEAAPEAAAPEPPPPNAWPDADRRSSRPVTPAAKAAPSAATADARRANPLVAGLVRAMREAARTAHDEAAATLRVDVAARTEAIHEYGIARAAELKKAADADVLAIREWSKAEMARVREETESKIAARKIQLVAETERESRDTDALLARLTAAVEAFEAETEAFFKMLLAEEDPGRLAGLAEQLPPRPSLEDFPAAESAADNSRTRAVRSQPATPRSSASAAMAEADAPAPATADVPVETTPATDDTSAAHGLDADAAAAAEAEALLGLDEKTQLIVSGLTSVGAIAGFKGALLGSPGVSAVSVNAGADGDVLITLTHAADTDVRRALRDMESFQPAVIADDGATLVVVAREPGA